MELQPDPFGECEFSYKPHVVKINHARPSERPKVTTLGKH